jgi:hypothetical protein
MNQATVEVGAFAAADTARFLNLLYPVVLYSCLEVLVASPDHMVSRGKLGLAVGVLHSILPDMKTGLASLVWGKSHQLSLLSDRQLLEAIVA